MPSILIPAVIILFLVASTSVTLLTRDVAGARLRERVASVAVAEPRSRMRQRRCGRSSCRPRPAQQAHRAADGVPALQPRDCRAECHCVESGVRRRWYRRLSSASSMAGLSWAGRSRCWSMPVEALFVARFIFGWERARFQKVLLEQVPDVMALICRSVAAGIPLSEALRSVSREASEPSREEFVRVVNEVAIGQSLEGGAVEALRARRAARVCLLRRHHRSAGPDGWQLGRDADEPAGPGTQARRIVQTRQGAGVPRRACRRSSWARCPL